MAPEEIGERIVAMDVKLTNLCELLKRASGDDGFNRCSERKIQIENLENTTGWIVKTGIGTIILVILVEITRFVFAIQTVLPSVPVV